MRYRVHFSDTAESDAEAAYDWIAERAPRAAVKWFNGLKDVVEYHSVAASGRRIS